MSKRQFSEHYYQLGEDTAIYLAKNKGIALKQIELWLTSIWKPAYWVR